MLAILMVLALASADSVASGRVVRVVRGDTVPAADATVLLHRVGTDQQGAIDSIRSGPDGRFAFRFVADTGASYLVSARWSGLEYFAPPLMIGGDDRQVTVVVADTAVDAPVAVAARHLVLSAPAPDGTRTAVDLMILRNGGSVTRVRRGDDDPTWQMILPANAVNVRVAESDFAPTAFDQHGDTLLLFAPIPPGEREIFLDYQIAPGARTLAVTVGDDVLAFNLMSEEAVSVEGLVARPDTTINERRFHRWSTAAAVSLVTVRFPGTWAPPWLATALAVALAVTLAGVTWWVLRPRHRGRPAAAEPLVDALVTLDADARARGLEPGGEGWDAYLARRAQLKATLARRLSG